MAASIIDGFIIVLLAAAIGYGFFISMKVRRLMAVLEELGPLVDAFSSAVDKTEYSVDVMKESLEAGLVQENETRQTESVSGMSEETGTLPFSSSRNSRPKIAGMQIVRDKKDLVRMFFETSRAESRA